MIYIWNKNSETTKAFFAFVQNKLHFAVTGQTAAELIYDRVDAKKPTMGLTTWKDAPDGKIYKKDIVIAKNYLNEKEMSRLNRLVTMFIDYAELMAEDEILMSMQDWVEQTNPVIIKPLTAPLDRLPRGVTKIFLQIRYHHFNQSVSGLHTCPCSMRSHHNTILIFYR